MKTVPATFDEKLVFYATAPRAYVGQIEQLIDGDFVKFYVGKLRGRIVQSPKREDYKFNDRSDALESAREFREACRRDAKNAGLL